jgi:hypothetical protein
VGGPPLCALAGRAEFASSAAADRSRARRARRPVLGGSRRVPDDGYPCRRALPTARAGLDSRAEPADVRHRPRASRRLVPDTRHVEPGVRSRRPQSVRARLSAGEHDRRAPWRADPLRERARPQLVRRELRAGRTCARSGRRLARALALRALPPVRVARGPARHGRGCAHALAAASGRRAHRAEHAGPSRHPPQGAGAAALLAWGRRADLAAATARAPCARPRGCRG